MTRPPSEVRRLSRRQLLAMTATPAASSLVGCSETPSRIDTTGPSSDRTTSRGQSPGGGYARRYDPLGEQRYDLSAVYYPSFGGPDRWDGCVRGEPAVGPYNAPAGPTIVNRQIDLAQGFGIGRLVVRVGGANDVDQVRALLEAELAGEITLELAYDVQDSLGEGGSVRDDIHALRSLIGDIPRYSARDGRPVVSVLHLAEYNDGLQLTGDLTSEFEEPEQFVAALREGLSGEDGPEPYLVGNLVQFGPYYRTEIEPAFLELAARFDALSNRPWDPGRGVIPWDRAYVRNVKLFQGGRLFADDHGLDFIPTVYPGWDNTIDRCSESAELIPRDPTHLAALLGLARQYSTTDRLRIDSFNHWGFGNQIEPGTIEGESYGTAYLEVARSFQRTEAAENGADRRVHHVGPDGSDASPGSEARPLATIQHALFEAGPGDTISVHPGHYREDLKTVRAGRPDAPITITGPTDAVVRAVPEASDLIRIQHDHVHLRGMTLTGLHTPDSPDVVESYAGNITEITPMLNSDRYLEGIVFQPDRVGHTRRALVNILRSRNVDVGTFRVIGPAGVRYILGDIEGHNGEIVYVGTAPPNLTKDFYPWEGLDETSDVRVHHIDNSAGYGHSEIVNTKLGTHDVLIEYCTDGGGSQNTEPYPPASINVQSHGATVRWCDLRNGEGYGISVGSHNAASRQMEQPASELSEAERLGGTENAVYGNRVVRFGEGSFRFPNADDGQTPDAQRVFCGNEFDGQPIGTPGASCPTSIPSPDGIGHTGGVSPW